jgi:NADH-quinone oxidoreductase subunit H
MVAPGLDIGILYTFAIGSLAVYGVILAGWSANNKYSLLGSLRSSAQIISYEIPLGMSIVGVLLYAGSMNIETVTAWQAQNGWFLFYQPLAFLLFMVAIFAECNRLPFDLPEAEQELVGGYHTEYSNSMKLGLMLLAEYAHMLTTSFLMSLVFWGGWSFFGVETLFSETPILNAVIKAGILGAKMFAFVMLFLLVRWTIPRFRFDQLMDIAWKVMIPLSILHLLAALTVVEFGLPKIVLTLASLGLFVAAGAMAVGRESNNKPRKRAVPLPVGVPEGVTYIAR